MKKRLSLIIPTYNCAEFLDETLGSVLPQLPDDCELIVVDDGYADETPDLLRKYADRHQGLSFGEDRLFNYEYLRFCRSVITSSVRMFRYMQRNPESASKRSFPDYFNTIMMLHNAKMDCFLKLSEGTTGTEKRAFAGYFQNTPQFLRYWEMRLFRSLPSLFRGWQTRRSSFWPIWSRNCWFLRSRWPDTGKESQRTVQMLKKAEKIWCSI